MTTIVVHELYSGTGEGEIAEMAETAETVETAEMIKKMIENNIIVQQQNLN